MDNKNSKQLVKLFVVDCLKELKIKNLPKVIFTKDKAKTQTLGHNNLNNKEIIVFTKGRLLADVLRTLSHEFVHSKQDEDGRITNESGNTGSDIENEANAFAGVMLRNFGQKHPDIYSLSFSDSDKKINEIYHEDTEDEKKKREQGFIDTYIDKGNVKKHDALLKFNRYTANIYENQEEKHEYGCLMLKIPFSQWNNVLKLIDKNDLAENKKGLETTPHVTILYGLHENINLDKLVNLVVKKCNGEPVTVNITGMGLFENENFDVLKFNVESQKLNELNHLCESNFPNSNEYPKYSPHITIAYLKKGLGRKYIKTLKKPFEVSSNNFLYSSPDGSEQTFKTY